MSRTGYTGAGKFSRRAGVFLALSAVLLGCSSSEEGFSVIETIDAREGLIAFEYAPSDLEFGPASFQVRLQGAKSESVLYRGTISNAGSAITLENVRIDASTQGFLWLCLNGVEQDDLAVRIEIQTGLVLEEKRNCSG